MKILVFSPYYPPHIGGLESHSKEFNQHLAQREIDVLVFTPRLPKDAPEKEVRSGVRIIRFPAFEIIPNFPLPQFFPFFWTPGFWRAFRLLWSERHDIVISRTRFFVSSLLALVYAKLRGIPLIHIEHGSDFVQLSSRWKTLVAKLYDHTLGRLLFRFSNINISISGAVQKFVNQFDKRPSPVIYRGLDFETLDAIPVDTKLRERFAEKIILTTAARLYQWKGIENTIAAIRALPQDLQSKIVFLIVGDGEDFERLKKLSEGFPIEMLGQRSRSEVIGILKASDIYIHSSHPGGGLSTSLLEAMYCHTAIIATKNEGADEVVEDNKNGVLVAAPEKTLFAEKITSLVQDVHQRNILGQMAHHDIRERFNWEKSIKQYLSIFRSL